MKQIWKFAIVGIGIITLSFLACSQEAKEENKENIYEKLTYEDVGRLHNEGLDHVLNHLKTAGITRTEQSIETFQTAIDEAVDGFMNKHNLNVIPLQTRTYESGLQSLENMTDEQAAYYAVLMEIFTGSLSVDETIKQIFILEENIIASLSEEDAMPLLCGTAVARYTAQYWSENMSDWYELMGVPQTRGWFSWGDVGKDDISYGVGGAIGGAAVGALAGGAGAGPGALVGGLSGAIGGSASCAVSQLLDHWF